MKGKAVFVITFLFFCFCCAFSLKAQLIYNLPVTGAYQNQAIPDILTDVEKQLAIKIYYDPNRIPLYPVSHEFKEVELRVALKRILKGSNLVFTKYNDQTIVITKFSALDKENADRIVEGWTSGEFTSPTSVEAVEQLITIGDVSKTGNGPFEVLGKMLDEESREPIIGATIAGEGIAVATDVNGFFKLKLPRGLHVMEVNYIGYRPLRCELTVYESGEVELPLSVQTFQLQEVIVKAESAKAQLESTNIGLELLDPKEIKKLPSFMGEADVVRSLELLPGVSTVGEGASGFNVRGGSIDQNLVLQDGGMIFNSSHALGIFSIFNSDAVRRVTLYKGNIPAQYGGRLSSVLDVEMRDGNFTKYSSQGGIGLASSRLLIEGPIIKKKLSFLAGIRTSYADWMLRRIEAPDVRESSARFRDWSLRMTYQLSSQTTVTASAFSSYDFFRFAKDFGYAWQTDIYQANVRHFFNEKTSVTFAAIYGKYESDFFDPEGFDAFDYSNGIDYVNLKANFIVQATDKLQYLVGGNYIRYNSSPEIIDARGTVSAIRSRSVDRGQGDESSVYANATIKLSDAISLAAGLRYTFYRQLGPGVEYNYESDQPLNEESRLDSTVYAANEAIQTYGGLEPRLSLNIQLSDQQSLKLSYNRMAQYIHLLSNTAAATPADVWQLSTPNIGPQTSDNFNLGYFHNFNDNEWLTSIEVYYKTTNNIVTYKDFPELLLNPRVETEIVQAEGQAYGVEVSATRTLGKWSGRASYTYSRSLIRTPSDFVEERINQGEWFPADFDQPHRINLAVEWKMSPVSSMQFNFTFRSGRPISFPTEAYGIEEVVVSNFSPRNQFRIPAYHRFDWSINIDKSEAKRKGIRSNFTISLYNLYARKNPFSFFFRRNDRGVQQAYKLSVLGSAFPALSYNYIF